MARKLREILGLPSLRLVNGEAYKELGRQARASRLDLPFLKAMPPDARSACLDHLDASKAQLHQDLFVLSMTGFKRGGSFVEFGATDGVKLSNTALLEKEFGWTGILAEPAREWHSALKSNRTARVETRCVWKETGQTLMFNETKAGELSTIDAYSDTDLHAKGRRSGTRYEVETVSLADLLETHGAPERIDYLSIDTEGSEFDILEAFDFGRHRFNIITCEHNFTPQREKIHALLTAHGYQRRYEEVSRFDDWYVHSSL